MRKALITLLAAATVLTPAAAMAQRGERRNYVPDDPNPRAERVQQRQEQRQAQPQQQPQQQQQQVAQNDRRGGGDGNRGNRGGWRGNDGNRGGGDNNRGGGDGRRGGNDGQNDGNRNWRGNRGGGQQQSIYPQAWQGNPNDPRLRNYQELERRNQQRYGNDSRRGDRGNDGRNWRNDDRRGDRDWRGDRGGDRRSWNGNWRNDRRYDWRSWRNSNRNIFRGSRYYSPYRNWGYNRFSIGVFLEPLFYSQNYWIGDPWQYRLPPAYPGTQWVRYYNDVLLVDVYSGEVLDVIHDFFW